LLARDLEGDFREKAGEHLAFLTGAASGMERLIQALLRYAQVGEAPMKREWVTAAEVLAEVEISLSALRSETHAKIEASDLPTICVDRMQFQQLLQNLIVNSIHYSLPGSPPYVLVEGENTAGGWAFAVSDRGQGISPEYLERVFTPLTRLHGSDVPGSGLGLALCRTIVERHGGRIWAESPGTGKGTTIRFVIPEVASDEETDGAHC
jgi:signal transduction histidine kinase